MMIFVIITTKKGNIIELDKGNIINNSNGQIIPVVDKFKAGSFTNSKDSIKLTYSDYTPQSNDKKH